MIRVFEPSITSVEQNLVNKQIASGQISSQTDIVKEFERELASLHGRKHCIVTANCTVGLHLAMLAYRFDVTTNVALPALTFIAPANACKLTNANLHLIDIDPVTLNIDLNKFEKYTDKCHIDYVVAVNQFGCSLDYSGLEQICRPKGITILEDNAESFLGSWGGQLNGTFGHTSFLSFFANKFITTGEGGAVLTDDEDFAQELRVRRDHGMNPKVKYDHQILGTNYRMTAMSAAIGMGQLSRLKEIKEKRNHQMGMYEKLLSGLKSDKFWLRKFPDSCEPSHWLQTIFLRDSDKRNEVIDFLLKNNIECRPMIPPLFKSQHLKPIFEEHETALNISQSGLHLPSGTDLTDKQIEYICSKVGEIL